ncbi:MAG: hypothetical protein J4N89_00560 [Chloroflexi bacterium]|nr:hypothetical protein [Chloroflexota bacterium]
MSQAQPPEELRPWYYKNPALFPVFLLGWPIWMEIQVVILWPAWAILIIRSPWHRGMVSGTLAWAMLMSGGAFIGLELFGSRLGLIGSDLEPSHILLLVLPGLVYTVVTQTLWAKSKQAILGSIPLEPATSVADDRAPRSQRERLRRRLRRRASRPGRSSRHPF